jgi:hypothetical protein
MPPANRLAGRNVHIYDANDRTTALGGLILNSGVTNDNFYAMIDIFVEFERSAEVSPADILINGSSIVVNDPLMSFYVGTSGRLS